MPLTSERRVSVGGSSGVNAGVGARLAAQAASNAGAGASSAAAAVSTRRRRSIGGASGVDAEPARRRRIERRQWRRRRIDRRNERHQWRRRRRSAAQWRQCRCGREPRRRHDRQTRRRPGSSAPGSAPAASDQCLFHQRDWAITSWNVGKAARWPCVDARPVGRPIRRLRHRQSRRSEAACAEPPSPAAPASGALRNAASSRRHASSADMRPMAAATLRNRCAGHVPLSRMLPATRSRRP